MNQDQIIFDLIEQNKQNIEQIDFSGFNIYFKIKEKDEYYYSSKDFSMFSNFIKAKKLLSDIL